MKKNESDKGEFQIFFLRFSLKVTNGQAPWILMRWRYFVDLYLISIVCLGKLSQLGVAYVNRDFAAIARLCHWSLAAVCTPCRLYLGAGFCHFSYGVCLFDERIAKGWWFILFLRFISFKRYWWVFSSGVAKDKKHTYIHVHVELYMRMLLLK